MRIKFAEFEELAKRKGYRSANFLIRKVGGHKSTLSCLKSGCQVGHEIVKEIYNCFGEEETLKVIDFEEETLNGLKAKYIQIGKQLY